MSPGKAGGLFFDPLKVGDACDDASDLGVISSKVQFEKISKYIEDAQKLPTLRCPLVACPIKTARSAKDIIFCQLYTCARMTALFCLKPSCLA